MHEDYRNKGGRNAANHGANRALFPYHFRRNLRVTTHGHHMNIYRIGLLVLASLFFTRPIFAAVDVAACDLFDEPTVSSLIGEKIKQNDVNRKKYTYKGITSSDCNFIYDRHVVRVNLSEYGSNADAAKAYSDAIKSYDNPSSPGKAQIRATLSTESGLGDKAFWYQYASEQAGYTVLKGNRIVVFRISFKSSITGSDWKGRSRPLMQSAARKL